MNDNPRDRVLAALAGEDIFPVPTDVMENIIYPKLEADLCHHNGLSESDHEGLLKSLRAHNRWGKPLYIGPPLEEAPVQPASSFPAKKATRSIWGSWAGMNTYSDTLDRPLSSVSSVEEVHRHTWPDTKWFDYTRIGWVLDNAEDYLLIGDWAKRHKDVARVIGSFDPLFSRIMDLCRMEYGLELMAAEPDIVHALVEHISEFLETYYTEVAHACKGYVDFLAFGDDFAGQTGMLISPVRWREYFLPAWKRLFSVAHKNGMKAMFHSCGGIRPVLGDLIDAGMDVFEVVQTTADGMDPFELKREFGKDVTFYGGIDTQQVLPRGTTAEVRAEVRRIIDALADGGRFILASSHVLMEDVPAENVLAMYDEALTYIPTGRI